jgi:hypothetical protein
VADVTEVEAVTATTFVKLGSTIDEKHGIVYVVLSTKFGKEFHGESIRSDPFKLYVE